MTTFVRICLLFLPALAGSRLVFGQNNRLPGLELAPGDTTAAVFPLVNIYKSPTANAPQVGQLTQGQIVVVKQKTEVSAGFDGFRQFWYEVAFGRQMKESGFVFGPGLASGFTRTPDGTCFLLRVIESGNENADEKQVEIKVADKKGSLVSFVKQMPVGPEDSLVVYRRDSLNFFGYTNMVVFDFTSIRCPDRHRELGVLWNGERAMQMPALDTPDEAKSPCFSYRYVLPDAPDGEPGILKIRVQKTATQQTWARFRFMKNFGFIEIRN
ncbi:MAG TPA: hypothetical protein PKL15_16745 [Saprospiraceae bacterium]|nr:hypothetical protein [Saprospiraceae bacterium]HNL38793.1 hypothetical protein [Saprospiraceae bacterium]HNM27095.1 hypothetical protein [Saprospiraceae bacterium]